MDPETRAAILTLRERGVGTRRIAQDLRVSRTTVKRVIAEGASPPPAAPREESATPHAERIAALFADCRGNLVRVQEELAREGVTLAYSTLTGFCRRHGIGVVPPKPVGRYHFEPGEEMQHDTSPHKVQLGERENLLQCASLVLCHSRMIYAQLFPVWDRFWCKVFLTDAILAMGGAAGRCEVDNSHVVLASGSGKGAVFAPEMEAFSSRFGFVFEAHEKGHAERSGRVERPFAFIENNFYPGRRFADLADANAQLCEWCDVKNASFRPRLGAAPAALYAMERAALKPLPLHVPAVERIHVRVVDTEGFVHLHRNRDSVPFDLIGRDVQVHEGKERVRVFVRGAQVAEHGRLTDGADARATVSAHHQRRHNPARHEAPKLEQERVVRLDSAVAARWLDAAAARGKRNVRLVRQLHRLWMDYPREPLERALATAEAHDLFDAARVETMVLRELGTEYFRLDAALHDARREGGDDESR